MAMVIIDGAGRNAVIDSKAQMVEADTAIISQEGDKFVNVNGVGLVKEIFLSPETMKSSITANNSRYSSLALEISPTILTSIGEEIEKSAFKKASEMAAEGKLVGTNNVVYQSHIKTKAGDWKNIGNQHFTTTGIDPLKHPKLLGRQNDLGRGVKTLGRAGGELFGVGQFIADERNNPFSMLPTGFLTDIQMEEYDMLDIELLEHAISRGYSTTRQYLNSASRNLSNKAIQNLILEDVQPDILNKILNNDYSTYESILEAAYSSEAYRSSAVLLRMTDQNSDGTKFQLLGVFYHK